MSQPDFYDYLNGICSGIRSRQKREDVMEELLCHLEDNYERNLAVGMTEEEAKEDAISKMGDSETLSYRLSAIHSYSPLEAMSSAFVTLIVAYLAMNFIFRGAVKEILFLIGIPVMFSPLLRMRKMNGTTEKAFHFFNFYVLSLLFSYCIGLGTVLPLWVNNILYVVIYGAQGFFWFLLFKGLYDFCQPFIDENEEIKKPHLLFCGVYHLLLSFFNGFMLILAEGETGEIPAYILPFFMIFMFFFTTAQFMRVRRLLWDADGEYGILPNDKKHVKICIGVFSVCLVTVLSFNYLSSAKEPVKTELIIHDVSKNEQKQADKVRQKMLKWDVNPQIVEDLPDSEILKYKDAEFVTWGADGGSMGGAQYDSGTSSDIYYYWFFIPDENYEGEYHVRLLCYIESHYADSVKGIYRKGFYYMPWNKGIMPLNLKDENNGSFISIVTEENGKKYNAEPFFTHNLTDENITTYPKGFEYREEKGQRVYYSTQIGVTNLNQLVNIYASTVRKRWFCSFNYNTTADFIETIMDYDRITSPGSGTYIPFYWRLHTIATGNFDDEAFDKYANNSFEYDGYYIKE